MPPYHFDDCSELVARYEFIDKSPMGPSKIAPRVDARSITLDHIVRIRLNSRIAALLGYVILVVTERARDVQIAESIQVECRMSEVEVPLVIFVLQRLYKVRVPQEINGAVIVRCENSTGYLASEELVFPEYSLFQEQSNLLRLASDLNGLYDVPLEYVVDGGVQLLEVGRLYSLSIRVPGLLYFEH